MSAPGLPELPPPLRPAAGPAVPEPRPPEPRRPGAAIIDALNDAAADAGDADEDFGIVAMLRGLVDGIRREGRDAITADELQWIADDLAGPPWPP